MTEFKKRDCELSFGQCLAGIAYLATMLAVLWVSTSNAALVLIVLVVCMLAGAAHLRLSRFSAAPFPASN